MENDRRYLLVELGLIELSVKPTRAGAVIAVVDLLFFNQLALGVLQLVYAFRSEGTVYKIQLKRAFR